MKNNWHVETTDTHKIDSLVHTLEIPRILACTLVARGHDSVEEASRFLHPQLDRDWNDPLDIPGLIDAVDTLEQAIRQGKKTLIFGDFDVDGITATSVMLLGLRACGLEAKPFIPRRQDEGYGLSREATNRIMGIQDSPTEPNKEPAVGFVPELIITVDCGITSDEEVEYIKSLGIDVVVTDHHNPMESVPRDVAVCNPRLDPKSPSINLAGVGVALKVIQVLGARFGKPDIWKGLTDLAALGTIADRMPLLGENRALVKDGIELIKKHPRPGIAALLVDVGVDINSLTSNKLSFSVIPKLNATGRMTNAMDALNLILCEDPVLALGYAKRLEEINVLRRNAEMELLKITEELAKAQYSGKRVMVLAGTNFHDGVKGIVASRLANKFKVPTVLFSIEGDIAHGSGRSFEKIDLFEAVSTVEDLTVKFGGHKFAAGITVKTKDIDEFRRRLEEYFDKLPPEQFEPSLDIDGIANFDDFELRDIDSLQMLEPCGQDNEEPLFEIDNVFLDNARAVGANKDHFSFGITNGVQCAKAIYFKCNDIEKYISYVSPIDLVFAAQIDEWRGQKQVKLRVKDIKTSSLAENASSKPVSELVENLYADNRNANKVVNPTIFRAALPNISAGQCCQLRDSGYVQHQNQVNPQELTDKCISMIDEVATKLTGDANLCLHNSQREAIESLCWQKNTLAVMATGRGKSLIFYVYAAITALVHKQKSIFIYPLRALINDQAYYVGQNFAKLDIAVQTLTGETSQEDREIIYRQWDTGEVPIILTTPEFLYAHKDKLSGSDVGFIAIDEAHHMGESKTHRPIYSRLGFVRSAFPQATILAVTATAPTQVAEHIRSQLSISNVVIDKTCRNNLRIDNKRGIADRQTYISSIVATDEKTVIYVNSRESSIELARMLRKRLPNQAMQIAFYNGALDRPTRLGIEELFRDGQITTVIATSAFGEGINVPDVRHIVLYHMPLSRLAYNQMAGRCGRDGKPAYIHLLFDISDIGVNHRVLQRSCPTRDELAFLYKMSRALYDYKGCPITGDELLKACNDTKEGAKISADMVGAAMGTFVELGLAKTVGDNLNPSFAVGHAQNRVDITSSTRYQEAFCSLEAFDNFAQWLLDECEDVLLGGINRPLLP